MNNYSRDNTLETLRMTLSLRFQLQYEAGVNGAVTIVKELAPAAAEM